MTYVRLSDTLPVHPKIQDLSDSAFRLYITAACWSNLQRTGGHLPAAAAYASAQLAGIRQQVLADPVIDELVTSGCWTPADEGGWRIGVIDSGGEFWDIIGSQAAPH